MYMRKLNNKRSIRYVNDLLQYFGNPSACIITTTLYIVHKHLFIFCVYT